MNKTPIAIYLQHYLAPSMTFIYRQLKSAEEKYNPIVLCSDRLENQKIFPYEDIHLKRRNFIRLKKSRLASKIIGPHKLLSTDPHLSKQQKKFFSNILKEKKVTLVHAHFGPSGLEILNLTKELNIPLLITFHGYDASILFRMKRYRKNIKKVFKDTYVIAVSDYMKNELINLGVNEEKIYVVRCGIPLELFKFVSRTPLREKLLSNEKIVFLQVSNFVEKKGHVYTVKAFSNYLKTNKRAKLILAGEGYLKDNVIELCRKLDIIKSVSFPGLVEEHQVIKLMNKADVFLHHSITSKEGDKEGIPTVIMEAMATGLPVVSTFHSGIPELISNNETGYLVEEKDIESYTVVLRNLINTPVNIGLSAREKIVSAFNLEIETQKLFQIYDRIITR